MVLGVRPLLHLKQGNGDHIQPHHGPAPLPHRRPFVRLAGSPHDPGQFRRNGGCGLNVGSAGAQSSHGGRIRHAAPRRRSHLRLLACHHIVKPRLNQSLFAFPFCGGRDFVQRRGKLVQMLLADPGFVVGESRLHPLACVIEIRHRGLQLTSHFLGHLERACRLEIGERGREKVPGGGGHGDTGDIARLLAFLQQLVGLIQMLLQEAGESLSPGLSGGLKGFAVKPHNGSELRAGGGGKRGFPAENHTGHQQGKGDTGFQPVHQGNRLPACSTLPTVPAHGVLSV